MFKILIPAVAALGLVAFAARTETPVIEVQSETPAMGWHLSHEGAIAKLAYGVENSDQLALMMTCMPGEATAAVYGDVQPATPRLTRASIGPIAPDPLSAGDAYETRIALHDATLQGLAGDHGLVVRGEAGAFRLTATKQERRLVRDFLSYCGTGRA